MKLKEYILRCTACAMKGVRIDDRRRITKVNIDPDPVVVWVVANHNGIIFWNHKLLGEA